MFPFQIRPDRALGEMQEFGVKLSHGLKTLSEIGDIDVGATEKDTIYTEDKVVLYHFRPLVENAKPIPVLIVYALVNRPYVADLQKNRSMVRGLLAGGLDVYLLTGLPGQRRSLFDAQRLHQRLPRSVCGRLAQASRHGQDQSPRDLPGRYL
jgi:hypothetical protein